MNSFMRKRVSQNRRRYKDNSYDLDLTYITENIVAMGYPSDSALQSLIRNRISTVSNYLEEKHKDSFKVFNLCEESDYSFKHFNYMVEMFPIEDHNPPKFSQIEEFCKSVDSWLNEKKDNVALVHCKAGKGRTGTMISCYFLYSNQFPDPYLAMNSFNIKRCKDAKGITIPSQKRYIEFYYDYLRNNRIYQSLSIYLKSIEIIIPDDFKEFPKTLKLEIFQDINKKLCDLKKSRKLLKNKFVFNFPYALKLTDDIRVCFMSKKKACVLKVSYNTFCLMQDNVLFEEEKSSLGIKEINANLVKWSLKKKDIDVAFKNKNIPEDLTVSFYFSLNERTSSNQDLSLPKITITNENNEEEEENLESEENYSYKRTNQNYTSSSEDNSSKGSKKFYNSFKRFGMCTGFKN